MPDTPIANTRNAATPLDEALTDLHGQCERQAELSRSIRILFKRVYDLGATDEQVGAAIGRSAQVAGVRRRRVWGKR